MPRKKNGAKPSAPSRTSASKNGLASDEDVTQGKITVDEIDVLRLQKLVYQTQSIAASVSEARNRLNELSAKYAETRSLLVSEIERVRIQYGLRPQHDIILDDDSPGLVVINEQRKAEEEAKADQV